MEACYELSQEQILFLNSGASINLGKSAWYQDEDGKIDINGNFMFNGIDTPNIMKKGFYGIHFGKVAGNFLFSNMKLRSLKGAPTEVGGYFNVAQNELRSTKGLPGKIGGLCTITHNRIVSLEDLEKVKTSGLSYSNNTLGIIDFNKIYGTMVKKEIDFFLAISLIWDDISSSGQEKLKPFLLDGNDDYNKLGKIGLL